MNFLLLDFETFGQNYLECPAIDLSVFILDTSKAISVNPYTLSDIALVKTYKLSVLDQVNNYGCKIENSSIEFWNSQPKHVKQHVKPKESDLTLEQFTTNFLKDYKNQKIHYWWSRSNTFDPIILWRLFSYVNKEKDLNDILPYWLVRDIRTFIDAKFHFQLKKNGFCPIENEKKWEEVFEMHNSRWDVLADALRFQKIMRFENDLEMIE